MHKNSITTYTHAQRLHKQFYDIQEMCEFYVITYNYSV